MVMSAIDVPVTTIQGLFALPEDGFRHELLRGEHVVSPSPRLAHQNVSGEFFVRLRTHVRAIPGLEALYAPSDVQLGADTLVQPDIYVVKVCPGDQQKAHGDVGIPTLVVEVLSPGTALCDRGAKREVYQEAGVAEYWIVDIDSRLVERWRPEDERPEILRKTFEWHPEGGAVLKIDLVELFESLKIR